MTRYEDPAGGVKHLRFGKVTEELLAALKAFEGIKAIVLHTHGKRGEHPHYHVWWEGTAITNQGLKKRLKAAAPVFTTFNCQNDWTMRNHDNWDTWAAYVTKNMTHEILLPYKNLEELSAAQPQIIAEGPLHNNPPPAIVIKKSTMREKFIYYLQNEIGWEIGLRNPTSDEVIKHAVEFWQAAFTNPEGVRMCRHALYMFSDDIGRAQLIERIAAKIKYDL